MKSARKATKSVRKSSAVRPSAEPENQDRTAGIVERVTEAIVNGTFAPGATLPAEGALAKSYGVSRTLMREAMRMLRGLGMIEMSQGKRPRVRPVDLQSAVFGIELLLRRNHASFLNLIEVRRPLEEVIAELAAERANDEHIRQLEISIHEIAASDEIGQRIDADVKFHQVLAEATGNPVFVLLLQVLSSFLKESREKTLNYSGVELAVSGHRKVLAAIRARDPSGARDAMKRHLQSAERDLRSIDSQNSSKR